MCGIIRAMLEGSRDRGREWMKADCVADIG